MGFVTEDPGGGCDAPPRVGERAAIEAVLQAREQMLRRAVAFGEAIVGLASARLQQNETMRHAIRIGDPSAAGRDERRMYASAAVRQALEDARKLEELAGQVMRTGTALGTARDAGRSDGRSVGDAGPAPTRR